MRLGKQEWDLTKKVYIMGILNVTPDSFSDGGRFDTLETALRQAEKMVAEGADIIDVGGESTRPGYTRISEAEELERVIPVLERLKREFDVPLSIDTYKAGVAEAAVRAGADLINDIWGAKYDARMAAVMAQNPDTAVCLMHNRQKAEYHDYLQDVCDDLRESVRLAEAAGVPKEQILIDPGIGFAKSYEQNLLLMKHLERLTELGYPVLLGTSRKSMIGLTLNLPAADRVEGTVATTVLGIMKGSRVIRVHDVKENVRAARMTEAILAAR